MSLGSLLSAARSGMVAQQLVIQTAGHNIANVETPGYSRQRVELETLPEQHWTYGSIGTGVGVNNVSQARDTLLDSQYRGEASGAASWGTREELLSNVEGVLGEPSDTGLASAMDAFWSSWSDLAAQPTSGAARSVVQQNGAHVASLLNGFDARLTQVGAQTVTRVDANVTRINALADEIAHLNTQIVASEVDHTTAGDLRDKRNSAIDELSQLGDPRVIENKDGSVQVTLGSLTLVDSNNPRHLQSITTASGVVGLSLVGGTEPMLPVGGSTQAMLDFVNHDLPDVRGRLDALARGLVSQVNALHRTGSLYPASGAPVAAGDFFDPTKVTAATMVLSTAVSANASNIAVGATTPAAGGVAGPGNNEVALAMAGLRSLPAQVSFTDATGQTQTGSFNSFYQDVNSRVGTEVANAKADAAVHTTLADQADTRRQSTSGVNLDEELTTLMRAQQAYAAAAKVISTASDMMKSLVDMV